MTEEEKTKIVLAELKARRTTIQKAQTRIKTYIDKNSPTETEAATRLGLLENHFAKFEEVQSEIEKLDVLELESDKRESFEETYCYAKSKLLSKITELRRPSVNLNQSSADVLGLNRTGNRSNLVKLPKIELPHFSGEYKHWTDFINGFNTYIDADDNLKPLEKFNYLRKCLKGGNAESMLASLELTDANYVEALTLLKKRYDNERLIYQAHIREISEIPATGKSVSSLQRLIDTVNANLRALLALGNHEQLANALLLHIVFGKLDNATQIKWEEDAPTTSVPTWKELESYLVKKCLMLENSNANRSQSNSIPYSRPQSSQRSSNSSNFRSASLTTTVNNQDNLHCVFCDQSGHLIDKCSNFIELSPLSRFSAVKQHQLCINCFSKNHRVRNCRGVRCRICHQRHHYLLHIGRNLHPLPTSTPSLPLSPKPEAVPKTNSLKRNQEAAGSSSTVLHSYNKEVQAENREGSIMLATAVVLVRDYAGQFVKCRVLLDSASQLNFITECLAGLLRAARRKVNISISGINDISTQVKHQVNVLIKSRLGDHSYILDMLILPSITSNQPNRSIGIEGWNIPSDIVLADPLFNQPHRIDMLIGAEIFYELLETGQIKLAENLPLLRETKFGWIVSGKTGNIKNKYNFCTAVAELKHDEDTASLHELLERFWTVESYGENKSKFTMEEAECEAHFVQNHKRLGSGRFVVKVPFKEDISLLGDSYCTAKNRFLNLERKLSKYPELKCQYKSFIHEYISLNHMEAVPAAKLSSCKYFMPHHCVIKPQSSTTKLRVVFDASCKTSFGKSLNEIQKVGPTIQNDLFSILVRFRFKRFAITADVTKMYRQIQVDEADSYVQCILWRDNPNEKLQIFRLKTVTYGTAAAPFLAIRCLHQLGHEKTLSHSVGSTAILNDFYVDDMLSGGDTFEEALKLKKEVSEILKCGCFELRKWASNDERLLRDVPDAHRETFKNIDEDKSIKTLGVSWKPDVDEFQFVYTQKPTEVNITKRQVLSDIASLFDPLGLINPIIVLAKILMQHLWRLKLEWDTTLPEQYTTQWVKFRNQLPLINNVKVPRFVLSPSHDAIEIHGFSDASITAYGCCIYIRSIVQTEVSIRLLCAKSRVAPVKTISLPRLELCSAVLLANLMDRIKSSIKINKIASYCWTDSEIVLNWLAAHPSTWTTFVASRVAIIQDLTSSSVWNHVSSKDNPADLVSRRVLPEKLLNNKLWFSGPEFLSRSSSSWPKFNKSFDSNLVAEKRKNSDVVIIAVPNEVDCVQKVKYVKNFCTTRRVFGFVARFVNNSRSRSIRKPKTYGCLTVAELDQSLKFIVKIIQRQSFQQEFSLLFSNKHIHSNSSIKNLNPFLDDDEIIRVGGRLQNSDLSFESKHPIILPNSHVFIFSLCRHYHMKNCHAGPQALLANLRQQFWIIRGRDVVKKVVYKCNSCFRARPKLYNQIMGSLPRHRVEPARPFLHAGVDFCGPVWVRYKGRGQRSDKAYIAVFVCFATKAVHIEIVSDLSSKAFLNALDRFVSRRGFCRYLYCDNGTNFVGGSRELKELRTLFLNQNMDDQIVRTCADAHIQFVHIPPRSPHFVGLWEAAVKSAKHHLYRVLSAATLTYEELTTITAKIEASLNSRPLTPLSSDPSDFGALTPGHFLIGSPLSAIVEPDLTHLNVNRLDRYQKLRQLYQHFWQRWQKEYISELQQRGKWKTLSNNVTVNTLVLIADEGVPPQNWILGRIIEVHPGPDGLVRVASVKTPTGIIKRAIVKLAPLPVEEDDKTG